VPLIGGDKSIGQVTADICAPLERRATRWWWFAFLPAFALLLLGVTAVSYQIATGIGTWGLNRTVGWAFDITNFVFWVGIGHAGTLISAILYLFRQKWRTSVNRSAEAMTLFAVTCAGLFPIIHMGRPWLFYWIFPYPNWRGPLWVNLRSPLVWDFFAISTYFTISLVFWYVGLIPDLATLRDRLRPGWYRGLVSFFSLGWNGAYRTWRRYEIVYMLLAGLATPLVVSVHSVVSADFAAARLPGWHTTIFPPYFVTGAIFSGMAMVLTLMLIARKVMGLEDYLTHRHIEAMTKLVLTTSCLVGLAYAIEFFTALYLGNRYESFTFLNRAFGPLGWGYGIMLLCNVLLPQLFWFSRVRAYLPAVFIIAILVNVGMWFERFIIIVASLERDFLPSSWSSYAPTSIEIATLLGSFGLFFTCFLIFCRFLPMIAMAEIKGVLEHRSRSRLSEGDAKPQAAHPTAKTVRATFAEAEDLVESVRAVRERNWPIDDIYCPYAVHGLEEALGWRRSRLSAACFAFGLLGVVLALWFQFWASAWSWPLNVGGQPWNSLPAFVPVTFECLVLFGGLGLVATWLVRCRLFPGKTAIAPLPGATDDRFVLVLGDPGTSATPEQVRQLLLDCRAVRVEDRSASEAMP
jgi:molybdopterin-containing oxidoreductase family membrane subunit